jgi:hypothetical protein
MRYGELGAYMMPQRTTIKLLPTILFSTLMLLVYHDEVSAQPHSTVKSTVKSTTNNTTMLIHDTQLLLSQHGFHIKIDGVCGPQTQHAIETYADTLSNKPNGNACSREVLRSLIDTLQSAAITKFNTTNNTNITPLAAKAEPIKDDIDKIKPSVTENINSLSSKIETLAAEIDKEKSYDTDTRNSINTNYNSELTALGILGISSFVALFIAVLAIITAIIIGILFYIKKKIDQKHAILHKTLEAKLSDMIDVSKKEILLMASTSHAEIAAKIYTMFSAHCINLYKDIIIDPTPGHYTYNMYRSYLDIAVSLANFGYTYAKDMQATLQERNVGISDSQKVLVDKAVNNYIFYRAQRATQDDDVKVADAMP